jgi:hypothetical protein
VDGQHRVPAAARPGHRGREGAALPAERPEQKQTDHDKSEKFDWGTADSVIAITPLFSQVFEIDISCPTLHPTGLRSPLMSATKTTCNALHSGG